MLSQKQLFQLYQYRRDVQNDEISFKSQKQLFQLKDYLSEQKKQQNKSINK
jgi:hypothetical protein